MNLKRLNTILAFILLVVAFCSIGGVFAQFLYTEDNPNSVDASLNVGLGDFIWQGSEILPDDEEEGLDHLWLIQNLVDGKNAAGEGIGLNNEDSDLNTYINNRLKGGFGWSGRNYFGSMAVTGDEEIEELFGAAAKGLSFIIEVDEEDSNLYYIYTTDVYLGERGETNFWQTSNKTPGNPTTPIGSYIEIIYRTTLIRASANAPFDIIETKKGKAKSDWYDENRANANITQIPAWDVDTWVEIN